MRAIGGGAAHHIRRHRAVLDEMRPTVCGSLHCNAAKRSMSDRQALGFHRPPRGRWTCRVLVSVVGPVDVVGQGGSVK